MRKQVIRSMLATTALAWFGMSPAQAMRCAGEVSRVSNASMGTPSKDPLRQTSAKAAPAARSVDGTRRKT